MHISATENNMEFSKMSKVFNLDCQEAENSQKTMWGVYFWDTLNSELKYENKQILGNIVKGCT